MAHYAFLDENNIVTEVITGIDEIELIEGLDPEIWYGNFRGQTCKRTSYNANIRYNYAGIGYTYDADADAFIAKIAKWIVTDGVPGMVKLGVQLGAGLIDALIKALKGIASIGLDIGKAFANGIIGFINDNVIDSINDLLEFKIAGFTVNPPDLAHIPKLADGGIVNSPTIAMIGEKGPEAVIPLSGRNAGNMGGNTITINTSADPQAVVLALQMYNRMSGPIPINTRGN